MSDMAGYAARVAVERGGRRRDTNRQSQIPMVLFKNKDDRFRTGAVVRAEWLGNSTQSPAKRNSPRLDLANLSDR